MSIRGRHTSVVANAILLVGLFVLPAIATGAHGQPPSGVWSDPVQISSTTLFGADVSGSDVYEFGRENLTVSNDGGTTWNPELSFSGTMDADGGILYRVDCDYAPGSDDLLFMKSTDDGVSWTSPVIVMQSYAGAHEIRIAKVGTALIVYSYEYGGLSIGFIKSSRSMDGGATWSTPVIVDSPVHCEDPIPGDIVYAGGKTYITYYNYSDDFPAFSDVVIIESSDLGSTWEDRRVVASGWTPMIASDSGSLYVTYRDDMEIRVTSSVDGDVWTMPILVGKDIDLTDAAVRHSVTAADGRVFVAHTTYDVSGGANGYRVYVNYSGDNGVSWNDMGDVTGGDGDERSPCVLFDGVKLHLTWVDAQGYVTFYRSFTFEEEPIPEFSVVILPVIGTALLVAALVVARRR